MEYLSFLQRNIALGSDAHLYKPLSPTEEDNIIQAMQNFLQRCEKNLNLMM